MQDVKSSKPSVQWRMTVGALNIAWTNNWRTDRPGARNFIRHHSTPVKVAVPHRLPRKGPLLIEKLQQPFQQPGMRVRALSSASEFGDRRRAYFLLKCQHQMSLICRLFVHPLPKPRCIRARSTIFSTPTLCMGTGEICGINSSNKNKYSASSTLRFFRVNVLWKYHK